MATKVLCAVLIITVLAVQDSVVFGSASDPTINYLTFSTFSSDTDKTCTNTTIPPAKSIILPTNTTVIVNFSPNGCDVDTTRNCVVKYTALAMGLIPVTGSANVSQNSCTKDLSNPTTMNCPGNISMPAMSSVTIKSVNVTLACRNSTSSAIPAPVTGVTAKVINGACP